MSQKTKQRNLIATFIIVLSVVGIGSFLAYYFYANQTTIQITTQECEDIEIIPQSFFDRDLLTMYNQFYPVSGEAGYFQYAYSTASGDPMILVRPHPYPSPTSSNEIRMDLDYDSGVLTFTANIYIYISSFLQTKNRLTVVFYSEENGQIIQSFYVGVLSNAFQAYGNGSNWLQWVSGTPNRYNFAVKITINLDNNVITSELRNRDTGDSKTAQHSFYRNIAGVGFYTYGIDAIMDLSNVELQYCG